ncbi:hypothetical protein ACP70R_012263 [Stipagrostis hirtigluma subsp. patula]
MEGQKTAVDLHCSPGAVLGADGRRGPTAAAGGGTLQACNRRMRELRSNLTRISPWPNGAGLTGGTLQRKEAGTAVHGGGVRPSEAQYCMLREAGGMSKAQKQKIQSTHFETR